jgi:hypothetical protein
MKKKRILWALRKNKVDSNVFFINNPDPNKKLMPKPDPNPDPEKKFGSTTLGSLRLWLRNIEIYYLFPGDKVSADRLPNTCFKTLF